MPVSMTTRAIVPMRPIRQLSGSIILKKVDPDWYDPDRCSRHYPFFLASVENLFPAELYGFLPMEDDNG
jgi:hypothetical protein